MHGTLRAMDDECLLLSARDGIFTITLNRPAALNAITPAMHRALGAAFDRFAEDEALQVCIVTGAGPRAFCAGSDLKAFEPKSASPYGNGGYAGLVERFTLDKPVIAAVNGLCLGGGFELALACDILLAAEDARFGLPEPRVGLIALAGGITRLVRACGLKRAMAPLLTGRQMSAAEGLAMGFVSEIAPADGLLPRAEALAQEIIACAPLAVRATKHIALAGLDEPSLAEALARQRDYPAYQACLQSGDAAEGIAAFAEKRSPRWQGR